MFRNASKSALFFFLVLQIQGSLGAATVSAKRSLSEECEGVLNPLCVKLNLLSLVEKMSGPNQFNLFSGVSLSSEGVKDSGEVSIQREARSLDDETEKAVDTKLVEKVNAVLESYTFNVKLMDEETARGFEDEYEVVESEGRRARRRKRKHLQYLLLGAAIIKKLVGAALLVKALIIAKKAILLSFISLITAIIVGLKVKKFDKEIPIIPEHHFIDHHSPVFAGYGRSGTFELPERLSKEE